MKDEKYIVVVHGVLKFSNGEKVISGGFVPPDISKEEIKDKLKRKQIAVFDNEISALVQSANVEKIDTVLELKNQISELRSENESLKKENSELKELIESSGGEK